MHDEALLIGFYECRDLRIWDTRFLVFFAVYVFKDLWFLATYLRVTYTYFAWIDDSAQFVWIDGSAIFGWIVDDYLSVRIAARLPPVSPPASGSLSPCQRLTLGLLTLSLTYKLDLANQIPATITSLIIYDHSSSHNKETCATQLQVGEFFPMMFQ